MNPGIGDTSLSTDTMSPVTSAVRVSLQFLHLLFIHCFRVALTNIHTVHVGDGVFSRCLGIIICCDIFLTLVKYICIYCWWYRSNSESDVVGCFSSSFLITIGSGFSSLVGTFRLDVLVVGEWCGCHASSSACVFPIFIPVTWYYIVCCGLAVVGTLSSWSSFSSLTTVDSDLNGPWVVWLFSTDSNSWKLW